MRNTNYTKITTPLWRGLLLALCFLCLSFEPISAQELSLPGLGSGPLSQKKKDTSDEKFDFLPGALDDDQSGSDFSQEPFEFEESQKNLQEEMRREAFDAAIEGLMPLRPNEIRELIERYDQTQESVELPVYPPPKPEVKVETLALDPGSKPTVVRVAYGYVTTVTFVDASGAPWPVHGVTWAGNFEVSEVEGSEEGWSNIIKIAPQSEFAYGNMSIQMVGMNTPIILTIETGRDVVYYRFDAIVPDLGPLAKTPLIDHVGGTPGGNIAAGNINITSFLEGVIPKGAGRLSVSGVDSRTSAYKYKGMTYLRTPLTLLSPAWTESASSADGMRVYALANAPVVLLSEKGRMVRARLSDREDVLDD